MNLVTEHDNIENPDRVTAFLVSKTKNVMQKGITIPPPPIPAIVHSDIRNGKSNTPTNSRGNTGNIPLCSHSFYELHNS